MVAGAATCIARSAHRRAAATRRLPIDVMAVTADGRALTAVAHVVARRRGRLRLVARPDRRRDERRSHRRVGRRPAGPPERRPARRRRGRRVDVACGPAGRRGGGWPHRHRTCRTRPIVTRAAVDGVDAAACDVEPMRRVYVGRSGRGRRRPSARPVTAVRDRPGVPAEAADTVDASLQRDDRSRRRRAAVDRHRSTCRCERSRSSSAGLGTEMALILTTDMAPSAAHASVRTAAC